MELGILTEALTLYVRELARMVPAFLIGVGVAATIKTFQWDLKLRAYMRQSGAATIPLAVFLGVFSPLCACGVLPIVIPLAVSGVALGPLMALLATSPLMSPDAFSITWAGLGPTMAWVKLISAAGMGITVGSVTYLFEKRSKFRDDIVKIGPVHLEDGSLASAYDIACAHDIRIPTMVVKQRENRLLFFLERARDTALFMGKFLLAAIALQVVMEMSIPTDFIKVLAGRSDASSLLAAALLGAPLPAHQVPVVPILKGLMDLGMDRGAAVTFLVAGPVTSLPALLVLWKVFHRRLFWLYLGLCLSGAVAAGAIFRATAGWLVF
ncbi:MAG: permease [bacterium]|nr:MAG: permease [bacterium]